jgi:cell division protein FtsN
MENRVRDLDQLEERDPEDRGRRVGMVVMATLGIVGLTFAMGVVVGKAAEAEPVQKDPLDQLDRVAAASAKPSAALPAKAEAVPSVDAAELSFPKALTEEEDRPEVLAALEAAAREEETLEAKPEAVVAAPAADEEVAVSAKAVQAATEDEEAVEERAEERVQAVLPAAVAAGSAGRKLAKAATHDQLVAASLPEAPKQHAAHGEEGAFTLQVISYDAAAPAQAFASGLRAKGHEAFVTSADVEGRGRYYRVRIGPFATRDKAEAYRHKFENDEHMNTIVVKRSKDDAR